MALAAGMQERGVPDIALNMQGNCTSIFGRIKDSGLKGRMTQEYLAVSWLSDNLRHEHDANR
jgi:hypothetical protein